MIFTFLTVNNYFDHVDQKVQEWFFFLRIPIVETIAEIITSIAHTETLAVATLFIVVGLILFRQPFKELLFFLLLIGGGIVITFLMKIFIERERPGSIEYIRILGYPEEIVSYSYPSGHAMKGLLLVGYFIYLILTHWKKSSLRNNVLIFLTAIIALIGIGQLILSKHYLSDIIGGYLVGLTWINFLLISFPLVVNFWNKNKVIRYKILEFKEEKLKG